MLRVEAFGGLAVVAQSGDPIPLQRRRLALLATLASASARGVTRDQLVGYFWPEATSEVARHSLEQLVYMIRRQFGEAVLRGGDPLSLNPELVSSDIAEFHAAIQRGDDEEAVRLYRAPFLDGVYLSGAPEFERWTTRERSRAVTELGGCFERLAMAATTRGDLRASVEWRLRRAAADPLSAAHALHLMRALAAAGDRPAALQHARTYQSLVRLDLGAAPDHAVAALADELRACVITPARPAAGTGAADLSVVTSATLADRASEPGHTDSRPPQPSPDSRDVPAPRYEPRARRGLWAPAVAICVVAIVTTIAVSRSHALRRAPAVAVPSEVAIAVLPLEGLSRDSATTTVADVLTAVLIETLTQSGAFRVIQGPSTFFFQGHERTNPGAIADSLGATILMSGVVERDGQNLRIALRLIDPRDATVRWARVYHTQLRDLFVVQDSIAETVVQELTRDLAVPRRPRRRALAPTSFAAYEMYRLGRHQLDLGADPARLASAIQYFKRSVALDPDLADSYAGLSASYGILGTGNISDISTRAAFDSARAAALEAIRLDPNLPEGFAALGFVKLLADFDWAGTEKDFAHAAAMNPFYARSPLFPAVLNEWRGDFAGAVRESRVVVAADPLSVSARTELGRAYFFAHDYSRALAQLDTARSLNPTFAREVMTRAELYAKQGQDSAAVAEYGRLAGLTPKAATPLALICFPLVGSGKRDLALHKLDTLLMQNRAHRVSALYVAIAYAGLGARDDAFTWLGRAYSEDRSIRPLIMDPTFDELRTDPRFAALLRQMHLRN